MYRFITGLVLFLCVTASAQTTVQEVDLHDAERDRPIKLRVWLDEQLICDQQMCKESKNAPVAIISHGAFGAPRDYNWLGYALASQGWRVIGIAHYGESWVYGPETIDPSVVADFTLRTGDVKYVLDAKSKTPLLSDVSTAEKVVILGHSSGGYTALNMLGATFDYKSMYEYCENNFSTDKGCNYAKGDKQSEIELQKKKAPQIDSRIDAIVTFDPALGPGVTTDSLRQISNPVLIFGSVDNDFLDYEHHAKYYASNITTSKLIPLTDNAGHFIYLDECNHSHQALGVSLCKDKKGVNRVALQRMMIEHTIAFLNRL